MKEAMGSYLAHALATSTQISYRTGFKCFCDFLVNYNITINPPPGDEETLMYFATHCANVLKLSHACIKTYICAIRYHCILRGYNSVLIEQNYVPQRLYCLLRGIKKKQSVGTKIRLPITGSLLKRICQLTRTGVFGPYNDMLFITACIVAYFGFLRCGEFTSKNRQFDPASNLCLGDIQFEYENNSPCKFHLRLKASKTDPFRKGVSIPFFSNNSSICPVKALHRFIGVRVRINSDPLSPLFLLNGNMPLTRNDFSHMLNKVLTRLNVDITQYAPHSFRIGAATSAAEANVEGHIIKVLGRWSSQCFQNYIHTPQSLLASAQRKMAP